MPLPSYIALIRGINVGGKSMPMAALRALFAGLGYPDAKTFIQSGNVVFTAAGKDGRKIAAALEQAIAKSFGYEAAVLVRSLDQWRGLLKANPYGKRKLAEGERLFVTFLEGPPAKAAAAALEAVQDPKDEVTVRGSEAFLLVRGSYGESNLSNAFVEKKLGVRATTRNMPTTLKLLEMAEALGGRDG
jgi:uncharacterized protein (DUF1697 family)